MNVKYLKSPPLYFPFPVWKLLGFGASAVTIQYFPQTARTMVGRLGFADVIMARLGYGYGSFGGMVSSERVESYGGTINRNAQAPYLSAGYSDFFPTYNVVFDIDFSFSRPIPI